MMMNMGMIRNTEMLLLRLRLCRLRERATGGPEEGLGWRLDERQRRRHSSSRRATDDAGGAMRAGDDGHRTVRELGIVKR